MLPSAQLQERYRQLIRARSGLDSQLAGLQARRARLIRCAAAAGGTTMRQRWALLIVQLDRRVRVLQTQQRLARRQLDLLEQLVYAREQVGIARLLEDPATGASVNWREILAPLPFSGQAWVTATGEALARRLEMVDDLLAWLEGLIPPAPQPVAGHGIEWATVRRVPDGDGAVLEDGRRVRYLGIDAPETSYFGRTDPHACEAKALNQELVVGKQVRLERDRSDTDRYSRLLRYVWAGELFVNAELVRQGAAWTLPIRPDTRHQALFERLQNEARRAHRGMWTV